VWLLFFVDGCAGWGMVVWNGEGEIGWAGRRKSAWEGVKLCDDGCWLRVIERLHTWLFLTVV
jgi:hypothetical protein